MLTKLILFLSVASLGSAGLDPVEFKDAAIAIKNDYKNAGVIIKKYVEGDTNYDIMENVNAINNDINDMIDSYSITRAKDKITDKFIILTDFIFNDTEINGKKFKELTKIEKEKVTDIYYKLDKKIDDKIPDYKEKMNSKIEELKDVKDEIKEYNEDKIIESIGEEKYNEVKEKIESSKEKTKETISNTYTKTKEKVTTWYNNLKQKKES